MSLEDIVGTLNRVRSVDDGIELDALDHSIRQLSTLPHPERATRALFGVFERFPASDGFGVFWSILQALEKLPEYEAGLVASLQRQPSVFGIIMLNRLLNSGTTEVDGVKLLGLLEMVAAEPRWPEAVRSEARFVVDHQR